MYFPWTIIGVNVINFLLLVLELRGYIFLCWSLAPIFLFLQHLLGTLCLLKLSFFFNGKVLIHYQLAKWPPTTSMCLWPSGFFDSRGVPLVTLNLLCEGHVAWYLMSAWFCSFSLFSSMSKGGSLSWSGIEEMFWTQQLWTWDAWTVLAVWVKRAKGNDYYCHIANTTVGVCQASEHPPLEEIYRRRCRFSLDYNGNDFILSVYWGSAFASCGVLIFPISREECRFKRKGKVVVLLFFVLRRVFLFCNALSL